jgi:hypothetical protein
VGSLAGGGADHPGSRYGRVRSSDAHKSGRPCPYSPQGVMTRALAPAWATRWIVKQGGVEEVNPDTSLCGAGVGDNGVAGPRDAGVRGGCPGSGDWPPDRTRTGPHGRIPDHSRYGRGHSGYRSPPGGDSGHSPPSAQMPVRTGLKTRGARYSVTDRAWHGWGTAPGWTVVVVTGAVSFSTAPTIYPITADLSPLGQ